MANMVVIAFDGGRSPVRSRPLTGKRVRVGDDAERRQAPRFERRDVIVV